MLKFLAANIGAPMEKDYERERDMRDRERRSIQEWGGGGELMIRNDHQSTLKYENNGMRENIEMEVQALSKKKMIH
ncbi:unnamed protein product [Prunus armeniaca]|uniref:Uncharacterized protein n=1 Tax=Prunus armeniaca TaxID=36596 RepID=A0A6J5VWG4_PRUAR|nr:unnamed protein product [Prunus armeniaca]CAB4322189.1 unnamed protein product [Prunus armeniaca]